MTPSKTNKQTDFYPAAMTIAGSDSGGGAGIQADLRTFSAFGVFGCSAITAITAQNPFEVKSVMPVEKNMLSAQIESVAKYIKPRSIKSGMLCSREIIEALCNCLPLLTKATYVLDPVMVSTSGAKLLSDDAVELMKQSLMKHCHWLTPNIPEAEVIRGRKINDVKDMREAALYCADKYQCCCLLKGGHAAAVDNRSVDIVGREGVLYELSGPQINCEGITAHGTGCTLSAALAAGFAIGLPWKKALASAKGFVVGSLAEAVQIAARVSAMYPPQEYYADQIRLKRL